MADISITKYKTKVTKPTASPSNPGYPTSDPIDPVNPPASGAGGGGVNTFLQLTDTPTSYTGQAGLFPRVNSGGTGLEFFNPLSLPITGYTVGSNTALASTDTILGAFGKVQGQINAKIGGTIASGQVAFGTGTGTIGGASDFTWDSANKSFLIGSARIINRIIAGEANNLEIQSGGLSGITAVRPSNNSASRFYIIPNQNQVGTGGKLDLFHTDYLSFPDDYSGSTWFTSGATNTVYLGNNRAGTATRFSFVIGGDFVGSGIQSTSPRIDFNTDNTLILNKTGGNIGFGPLPSSPPARFSFYENNTGTGDSNGILIEQAGTGDSILQFLLTGARRWVLGIDNSDGDSLKISPSADVGVNYYFNLTTSGNLGLGLNTSPTNTLDVNGTARIRTLSNATGDFVTASATGVLQKRTASEVATDIGAVTITGTQTITGEKTFSNSLLIQEASAPILRLKTTAETQATVNFRNSANEDEAGLQFDAGVGKFSLLTRTNNCDIEIAPHGTGSILLPNVPSGSGDVLMLNGSGEVVKGSGTPISQQTGTFSPKMVTLNNYEFTYTSRVANYIKIGSIVFFEIVFTGVEEPATSDNGFGLIDFPFSVNGYISAELSGFSGSSLSASDVSALYVGSRSTVGIELRVKTTTSNIGSAVTFTSGYVSINGFYKTNS